jgi:hypothetical protein
MSNTIILKTPFSVLTQKEEQASATNPTLSWMEFVFTDDRPNDNGVGVHADQFASLIQTGIYMPLKVAEGEVAPGHENALPLGVISNLTEKYNETSQSKQIVGKAALWAEERPEDVAQLKSAFASGNPLNISWELLYSEEEIDDVGIRWLKDPIVRAATIVGIAAYSGRTPVLAVASIEIEETNEYLSEAAVWTRAYINNLPDSAFLFIEKGGTKDSEGKTTPRSLRHFPYKDSSGKVDLPHLRNALARIPQSNVENKDELTKKAERILSDTQKNGQSSVEDTTVELEELNTKLAEATNENEALKTQITELNTELDSLKAFKVGVEQKQAQAALLQTRLAAFAEVGLEFSPEDIETKQAFWLQMDEEAFKFLVSELKGIKVATASTNNGSNNNIPEPVGNSGDTKLTAEILKNALKSK